MSSRALRLAVLTLCTFGAVAFAIVGQRGTWQAGIGDEGIGGAWGEGSIGLSSSSSSSAGGFQQCTMGGYCNVNAQCQFTPIDCFTGDPVQTGESCGSPQCQGQCMQCPDGAPSTSSAGGVPSSTPPPPESSSSSSTTSSTTSATSQSTGPSYDVPCNPSTWYACQTPEIGEPYAGQKIEHRFPKNRGPTVSDEMRDFLQQNDSAMFGPCEIDRLDPQIILWPMCYQGATLGLDAQQVKEYLNLGATLGACAPKELCPDVEFQCFQDPPVFIQAKHMAMEYPLEANNPLDGTLGIYDTGSRELGFGATMVGVSDWYGPPQSIELADKGVYVLDYDPKLPHLRIYEEPIPTPVGHYVDDEVRLQGFPNGRVTVRYSENQCTPTQPNAGNLAKLKEPVDVTEAAWIPGQGLASVLRGEFVDDCPVRHGHSPYYAIVAACHNTYRCGDGVLYLSVDANSDHAMLKLLQANGQESASMKLPGIYDPALAVDKDGKAYALQITSNGTTSVLLRLFEGGTLIGTTGMPRGIDSMAFAPDGTLYAMHSRRSTLYRIDVGTGRATVVHMFKNTPPLIGGDIAFDENNRLLYLARSGAIPNPNLGDALYEINLATLSINMLGELPFKGIHDGLAWIGGNRLLTANVTSKRVVRITVDPWGAEDLASVETGMAADCATCPPPMPPSSSSTSSPSSASSTTSTHVDSTTTSSSTSGPPSTTSASSTSGPIVDPPSSTSSTSGPVTTTSTSSTPPGSSTTSGTSTSRAVPSTTSASSQNSCARCPSGQCAGGQCLCRDDAQCPSGERCINGKCGCTDDKQCPLGQKCQSGVCTCKDNTQCPTGERCINGRCGCVDSSQCPSGQQCQNGKCTCTDIMNCKPAQCGSDRDCPAYQACRDGLCTIMACTGVECVSGGNALCASSGQVCLQYSTPPCAVCGDGRAEQTLADVILQQAFCGNGRVEVGEECDDGNARNGDGCSAFCGKGETVASMVIGSMLGDVPSADTMGDLVGVAPRLGMREFVFGRAAAPLQGKVAGSSTQEFLPTPKHAPVGDTGPAAVAVMAAGAAAGWSWVRRRRKT